MMFKRLISFEEEIAKIFNKGLIEAPIHLSYGNEKQLINIFKKIKFNDWIFCSWRSHYHCLLKGVPAYLLKKEILNGSTSIADLKAGTYFVRFLKEGKVYQEKIIKL